jgi:hypothetical protein
MVDLNTTNWVTIVGWPVTFLLGMCATLISQRILREKKAITWAVFSEIDLSPSRYLKADKTPVPLKMLVGGVEADVLHNVRLQIVNSGNKEIENVESHINFGPETKIMSFSLVGELGAWKQFVRVANDGKEAHIDFKHINPKQKLTVDALVVNYSPGNTTMDLSAPGVSLRQSTPFDISLIGDVHR